MPAAQREQHLFRLEPGWNQVIVNADAMPHGATLRRTDTASIDPLRYVQQPQQPQTVDDAQWSRQPGNCPLVSGGVWWVFHAGATALTCFLEPIDPGGQALSPDETPMHGVGDHALGTSSAVANTVTQLLPANRFRRSFTVWNRGTVTLRIGRGYQPAASEGVPVFAGTAVVFGNGENCVDVIYVASGGTSVPYTVEETQ